MAKKGYAMDKSELGNVYYPSTGICIEESIAIHYMDYPWISCFEVKGIQIL